jgi:hypothetical protein
VAIRTGEETLEAPRELNPQMPQMMEQVILRMMASRPEERYPNIGEVRKALRMAQKTAQTGIVRRVGLDSEGPIRKLPQLDAKGVAGTGEKRYLTPSKPPSSFAPAGPNVPRKPEFNRPPVIVHHEAGDEREEEPQPPPRASLIPRPNAPAPAPAPAEPAAPARGGLFGFFRRDPGFDKAWITHSEDGPKIQVVPQSYRNGIISFHSGTELSVNDTVSLWISIKNSREGPFEMSCTLLKETMVNQRLEYMGRMQGVPPMVDKVLTDQFPAPQDAAASGTGNPREGRRSPRIQTAFQVMSRQLPGYKAISTNISMTGIQLDVREEVKIGTRIQMKLDFDDFRFHEVNCEGEVKWCRPGEERDWLIGIAFVTLSEQSKDTVKRYIQMVAGSKPMRGV